MKIAYIAASTIPSSTANSIQVMKVCQALTQNGEKVHLFIPGSGIIQWEELAGHYGLSARFPISRVPSWRPLKRLDFVFRSMRHAKQVEADVIYTRMLWVAVGALMMHWPVILEMHDVPMGRFGPWLFKRYLTSKRKKLTVLITHALRKLIEAKFKTNFPEKEVIISPDGVDVERYLNLPDAVQARQQLGLREIPTAVYTGGFYEGRGLEILLELAKAFSGVQFIWVGGKPDAVSDWKAKIQNLGLENIVITGFVANERLPLYQSTAEVLLMPFGKSISGSSGGNTVDVCSPMKMFEYMAAGRVILTSDLPVLHEVLNDSNAAFYTPEDLTDFKAKFGSLMADRERRTVLAIQAKKDVLGYIWQERMRKIISFIGAVK
ncbi:MAG: hypothetical protein C0401_03110 [Anaerolinea sp.]|nr:hypothetical protein [Anaerolinea sp.]